MAIKVDHSKASNYYNVDDGTYDTIIEKIGFDKTQSGTEYIRVSLTVRQDVAQEESGETIDYPMWKSRPENRKASDIEGVPAWRIQQLSKCAGLESGAEFETIDDWFKAITGRPLRVTTEQDEKGYARVRRIEESPYPAPPAGFVPVDDEETPF